MIKTISKRPARITYLLTIVLLASACTGKVNTNPSVDPLRNVAVQVARLTDAANGGAKTVIALNQDGLITSAQERDALLVIQKANDAAGLLTTRLRNLTTLDVNTRASLLAIVNEVATALNDPKALTLFGVTNAKSKERLQGVISLITSIVTILKQSLGGA